MSEEYVEMFRKGLAGWNREGVEGVLPFVTADVLAHPFPEWPGPSVYRGHEEFRRLAAEWTDNFDEYMWDDPRVIDVGDRVVALVTHRGCIKGTQIPISQPMGTIWGAVRERQFGEVHFFLTWDEALKHAGVGE